MNVIIIDARYIGIGDDDEWEVAEGLDTVGEADGKQGEGEVCG